MDFTFNEDQLLFQTTLRAFLAKECTPEKIREIWESETGRSPELWAKLAEMGITGLLISEEQEGMGMDEIDAVLLHEELGRAGCGEPVISTAAVAAPLLHELGIPELSDQWLKKVAVGEAIIGVGCEPSPFVADANVADLLLLQDGDGDEIHAVDPKTVNLIHEDANDPSRRLYSIDWAGSDATQIASGQTAIDLWGAAVDRGVLAAAAQQLGVCDRLISMSAAYAEQRKQFGKPIGTFQAVKHMLANCKVKLEYARPVVLRAAHSVAHGVPARGLHVSMAKIVASEAAALAARTGLQVHGALGYTWEQDLHIWMRRAWSLEQAWGRNAWHRARIDAAILSDEALLGPGTTF